MKRRHLIASGVLLAGTTLAMIGCSGEVFHPLPTQPPTSIDLTVINRSMLELLEIRIHATPEYRSSENRLQQPLADDGEVTFVAIPNFSYVTVIRRRIEAGERIAFTTAHRLYMTTNRQQLLVFQQSFRLVALDNVDPPEGGPINGDNDGDSRTPGDP